MDNFTTIMFQICILWKVLICNIVDLWIQVKSVLDFKIQDLPLISISAVSMYDGIGG